MNVLLIENETEWKSWSLALSSLMAYSVKNSKRKSDQLSLIVLLPLLTLTQCSTIDGTARILIIILKHYGNAITHQLGNYHVWFIFSCHLWVEREKNHLNIATTFAFANCENQTHAASSVSESAIRYIIASPASKFQWEKLLNLEYTTFLVKK